MALSGPGQFDGKIMAAAVQLGDAFEARQPRPLFDARRYENSYAVSPDGQRLLMMPLITSEQSSTRINVVLNFLTELRQRVR